MLRESSRSTGRVQFVCRNTPGPAEEILYSSTNACSGFGKADKDCVRSLWEAVNIRT
jgi:hypothetical protein